MNHEDISCSNFQTAIFFGTLSNKIIRQLAVRKNHFDMSRDYGGPKLYKIIKHKQPGTVFYDDWAC